MVQRRSKKNRAVRVVRPEEPEARDEGPRLIPLPEDPRGESRINHYILLANIALGLTPSDRSAKLPAKTK
jgi:hypothetical protein